MPDASEVELIRRCQGGCEEAFREVMERYQQRTFWIARGMLHSIDAARDVSQDAFLRVFRNIRNFDIRKNFYTWLYQIVVNLCIDRLRRQSRVKMTSLEGAGGLPAPSGPPSDLGLQKEKREQVHRTLQRLPAKYKAVLTLRDIQGFSCGEIGEIVGCSNPTVRWRLHRARRLFRALWEEKSVHSGHASPF